MSAADMNEDTPRLGFFRGLVIRSLCCMKSQNTRRENAGKCGFHEEEGSINMVSDEYSVGKCRVDTDAITCKNAKRVLKLEGEIDPSVECNSDGTECVEVAVKETMEGTVDNNIKTKSSLHKVDDDSTDVEFLKRSLSCLECPFLWKPDKEGAVFSDGKWIYDDNERNGSILIEYLSAKEFEFRFVKNNFFRTLCINLVLAYEKALLGQLASSAADIYHCQMLVNKVESDADSSEQSLVLNGRKDGIYYVLLSSIAHISYLQGSYRSSWDIVNSVEEKYTRLSNKAWAVIHGLHAGVLMEYGYRGNRMALDPVRAAIALDPDCWIWSLFLGKLLGRFRRKTEFHMPAGREELQALHYAAKLHPDAQCLSHLADVYKHLNAVMTRQGYTPDYLSEFLSVEETESLPRLAKELYSKAAEIEPNCPYNNARCAKGLLSLPIPFKDMDLAEKYMVRALHLAPDDSLVNHYAAYYYETRKEFEQALDSYQKALIVSGGSLAGVPGGVGNFPAELGYLALQHRLETGQQEWVGSSTQVGGGGVRGGRYSITRGAGAISCASRSSPLFQLDAMLTKYKSKSHRVQTLCNKGYYLLMYERNVYGALRTFAEAIHIDPKSATLQKFWSVFGNNSAAQPCAPMNVYHLILKEIENALRGQLTSDDQTYLEDLRDFIHDSQTAISQQTDVIIASGF